MDKYEYNLKLDQIKSLSSEENYVGAAEIADTINKGDSMVFSSEKMLKEMDDKLSDEEKSSIKTLVDDMKKAVSDKNVDEINRIESLINDKWNEISTRLYSAQQQQATETTTNTDSTENVKDAEFEEVK